MAIKSVNMSLRLYVKDDDMPERYPCKLEGEQLDTFIRFLVGVYGWEVTVNYESSIMFDDVHVDRIVRVYTGMEHNVAIGMYERAVTVTKPK